jgi:hypothetical protein
VPINWKREPWRKLYVREEGDFAALPFLARCLASWLIKAVDDRGLIALGGRDPATAISRMGGAEMGDRRVVRKLVELLLAEGYLVVEGDSLRIRNFRPAQMRYDRVRGEHELGSERSSTEHEPSASDARTDHEPSVNRAPTEREPCTKSESPDRNRSNQAAPLDPIRNDTNRNESERETRARGPAGLLLGRDTQSGVASAIWHEQEEAKRLLREKGLDPRSRALGLGPNRELLARIRERCELVGGTLEQAAADCRHVLAVCLADAEQHAKTLKFLDGAHWGEERFNRALSTEVGQPLGRAAAPHETGHYPARAGEKHEVGRVAIR